MQKMKEATQKSKDIKSDLHPSHRTTQTSGKGLDRVIVIAIVILAALSIIWMYGDFDSHAKIQPGQTAPVFSLPAIVNAPVSTTDFPSISLESYRGKTVIITFFSRSCRACRSEMPQLVRLYEKSKKITPKSSQKTPDPADSPFVFLGIVRENGSLAVASGKLRRFAEDYGLKMPILLDRQGVSAAYGIDRIPQTIVIDPTGKLVSQSTALPSLP